MNRREVKAIQRVVTVRMSEFLHAALREEAMDSRISMNSLCILKLEQAVRAELVPLKRWQKLVALLKRSPRSRDPSLYPELTPDQEARRQELVTARAGARNGTTGTSPLSSSFSGRKADE